MKLFKTFWAVPALLLTGCNNQPQRVGEAPPMPTSPPAAPQTGGAQIAPGDLDKIAQAGKPWKLALVVKTRNNPFFSPMIAQAEAEAKRLGATLEVQAPAQESDKERQFAIVQDLVARKVDAILIAPADSKAIVPALKQALAKGITVVNLDNRVDALAAQQADLGNLPYVGADNEAGGRLAGATLAAALGDKGKVLVLEGIRGADNAEARKRGFMAAKGKLQVAASESAEWDTQKAYAKTQNMLAAHKDVTGIFCANDKMALGAIKAIRESGKKGKIQVVGYDNIPDVKQYLASGEMKATIDQHPDLMGSYGVKLAVALLDKKNPTGTELLVPLEVVKGK